MTMPLRRVESFCERFGLEVPILLAPMAGACPPSLSVAVANAGGMGAAGLLLHSTNGIRDWMEEFRASSNGAVQLNIWIPDPAPVRDAEHETRVREFLSHWGATRAP
jgi:nitronate monooxygenase